MPNIQHDIILFKNYLKTFINKTETELVMLLGLKTEAKSKMFLLAKSICDNFMGKSFFKLLSFHTKIVLKTIQLQINGKPKEAMSFTPIKYIDIVKEDWDTSTLRNYFYLNTFLFFIFQKKGKENYLINIKWWRMPITDLDGELKIVWLKVVKLLKSGNVIKGMNKRGNIITNFPRESENILFHVRPHGTNNSDIQELPYADLKTGYKYLGKQSFWFNHDYVLKICNFEGNSREE